MNRLLQLSRTNAAPSDEEAADMRRHLPILEEELRHLDVQLAVLRTNRERLTNQINRCRAALAPHKRLPPELIREIFLFSTAEHATFPLVDGAKECRLIVSQVCSTWRKVAFDTPTLWSIKIPYLPAVPSSSLELVGGWLSRCSSACLALNMTIGNIDAAKMESTNWSDPLLKHKFDWVVNHIIIPNRHCFRELALAIPHLHAKALCALPSGYFPKLRTVAIIQVDDFFAPFAWDTPITAFTQAPCLRRCDFMLGGVRLHDMQFPWAQLTHLVLVNKSISNRTMLKVLSACDSIVALHLGCVQFHGADGNSSSSPQTSLCLPNVEVFSVAFTYSTKTNNAPFLLSFSLPNIRRLVLKNTAGPNWSPSDYIAFLRRISPTLEIFELDFPRSRNSDRQPPRNADSLLECIPHVKTVRLPNDAPLLPSTMGKIGDGTLLPCIQLFEFAADNPLFALEMLSSRQSTAFSTLSTGSRSVSLLKASRINCSGGVPEAFKSVRNFQMQGLNVTFQSVN
jgi:F-box-like